MVCLCSRLKCGINSKAAVHEVLVIVGYFHFFWVKVFYGGRAHVRLMDATSMTVVHLFIIVGWMLIFGVKNLIFVYIN